MFNEIAGLSIPAGPIFIADGVTTHIRKRHPECLRYIPHIGEIIAMPDYIGNNPREPNSVEFVKMLDQHVQVAVKLDTSKGYLFVASLYEVPAGKVERRLHSGRLKSTKKD